MSEPKDREPEEPDIVRWFNQLMADPKERQRLERVVDLGRRSGGWAAVERRLARER